MHRMCGDQPEEHECRDPAAPKGGDALERRLVTFPDLLQKPKTMLQVADTFGSIRRQSFVAMAVTAEQGNATVACLTIDELHGSSTLGARHRYAVIPGTRRLRLHLVPIAVSMS